METEQCTRDGCTSPVKARKLCFRHYGEANSKGPCSVEGCSRPSRTRSYCSTHYLRWLKVGDPGEAALRRRPSRPCKVDGCSNGATTSRDLCPTHARRKRLYGTEAGSFATHKTCVVCGEPAMHGPRASDRCEVHYTELVLDLYVAGEVAGTTAPNGYVYVTVRKKRLALHRLVMERTLGRPLMPGETPHHKNGIRHDNRPENLELWVSPQPYGQRPEDLVDWVVEHYPDLVRERLASIKERVPEDI